jgi:phosphoribosylglycinamide formyltransferase-1
MRLAVLISGAGSNMVAIANACRSGQIRAEIALVISDVPSAGGIARAQSLGIATAVVDRKAFTVDGRPDRASFEAALGTAIDGSNADLIILAGFMRILSGSFVSRYEGRMLNIHPSLLPRHKGLDTHARALSRRSWMEGLWWLRPSCPCCRATMQASFQPVFMPGNTSFTPW